MYELIQSKLLNMATQPLPVANYPDTDKKRSVHMQEFCYRISFFSISRKIFIFREGKWVKHEQMD